MNYPFLFKFSLISVIVGRAIPAMAYYFFLTTSWAKNYVTSCSTTMIVPCVAHLYLSNTDEHLRSLRFYLHIFCSFRVDCFCKTCPNNIGSRCLVEIFMPYQQSGLSITTLKFILNSFLMFQWSFLLKKHPVLYCPNL